MSGRLSALRGGALSVAALLLLSGCWTSTDSASSAGTPEPAPATSVQAGGGSAPTVACPPGSADATTFECIGVTVTGARDEEPTITLDDDFAPADALQVADVYEGAGDPVVADDTLTVHYVGVGQQSKEVFDSSWSGGQPATFQLARVIEGWQQGMLGMKPGGRRLLVIPGSLAYGPDGSPPVIGPDETLVFVVDLVSVTSA